MRRRPSSASLTRNDTLHRGLAPRGYAVCPHAGRRAIGQMPYFCAEAVRSLQKRRRPCALSTHCISSRGPWCRGCTPRTQRRGPRDPYNKTRPGRSQSGRFRKRRADPLSPMRLPTGRRAGFGRSRGSGCAWPRSTGASAWTAERHGRLDNTRDEARKGLRLVRGIHVVSSRTPIPPGAPGSRCRAPKALSFTPSSRGPFGERFHPHAPGTNENDTACRGGCNRQAVPVLSPNLCRVHATTCSSVLSETLSTVNPRKLNGEDGADCFAP